MADGRLVGSVGIIGLGHVGLPLAAAFAEAGLSVVGIERDPDKVAALSVGDSCAEDVPSWRLEPLVSSGRLRATEDYSVLGETEAVLVCLPTPLDANREPDLSVLVSGVRDAAPHLHPGALVVLESTTYPGTTREVLVPILEEDARGLGPRRVGRDLFLAFSPERVDPGNKRYTIRKTLEVVGSDARVRRARQGTLRNDRR